MSKIICELIKGGGEITISKKSIFDDISVFYIKIKNKLRLPSEKNSDNFFEKL